MKKILVTGASGFIGKKLCYELIKLNLNVCGAVRNFDTHLFNNKVNVIAVGEIGVNTNWTNALKDTDCVIHCAGKVHFINEDNNANMYQSTNIEGTKNLAEQAVKAGVKRLIFLSSVKVNGEETGYEYKDKIFSNKSLANPKGAYAISKYETEKLLWKISLKHNLEVVVVRLPLVYGYGVKGNLKRLIKLIKFGVPLPFSLIKNRRSLIGIDNLVDVLVKCIKHPNAKGKTFLVSDGEDISTPNLLRYIASAMGSSAYIFPFPVSIIKFFCYISGKSKELHRLTESLQIDINYTKKTLNWSPPMSIQEGMRRMIKDKR